MPEIYAVRNMKAFCLFLIFLMSQSVYGLELEKVTTSLQYLYNYYYDPEALEVGIDSSSIIEDKDTLKGYKLHDTLPYVEIVPDIEINDEALYFVDSVPYIRTSAAYNGDKSDLHSLGVITGAYHGGSITVRFPLSILPQIVSLPTVEFIYDNARFEYEDGSELLGPSLRIIPPVKEDTGSK